MRAEFRQRKSNLFDQKSLPPIDGDEAKIHIPWSFRAFKPDLSRRLRKLYSPIRFHSAEFPSGMPLILTGKANRVVAPLVMDGENVTDATQDLFEMAAFTQVRKNLGPNVESLSVLGVFNDERQDNPSVKELPGEMIAAILSDMAEVREEFMPVSLVSAQSSWTLSTVDLMKIAGVKTYVAVDRHSYKAAEQYEAAGIETVNLTTAKLMVENLRKNLFLKENLKTVIAGVDFGNLALAKKLSEEEGFDLAIIRKHRIATLDGTPSKTVHELVYGDVRGKRVLLMDDMIGSGGTIFNTVDELLKNGAAEVIVCASQAVFAGKEYYAKLQEILKNDKVKLVMTSDTLPLERPTRGKDRSLPYILVPGGNGRLQKREVAMLEVDDFIAYIVGVMLLNPTADGVAKAMGEHVLELSDPYDLYYQITGKKVPRPVITHEYLEGGRHAPIEKVLADLKKPKPR